MKIAINQIQGGSGVDVWADNFCKGLHQAGHGCSINLYSPVYQFLPGLARLHLASSVYDLIQGNTWNGFAFKGDVPLVVTEHLLVHDSILDPYKSVGQRLYHRWIYRCEKKSIDAADAVISVSEYARKKLEDEFGFSDPVVIYNGIDTAFFKPGPANRRFWEISDTKTVIFYAGNLSKRKGADLLPAIMHELGEQYVLLTTTGLTKGSVRKMSNIIETGYLNHDQLLYAYNSCDIFLSPTRLEGFGLSVAEAMACGKPVVTTNCSSLPELVVDGKGGFLCRMDDVRDFAEKIRYLTVEEELRKKMGAFNRKRVEEKFELSRMVREYIDLYKSL
jgi:glycosyltransferase involved in cell wall biosynthesis